MLTLVLLPQPPPTHPRRHRIRRQSDSMGTHAKPQLHRPRHRPAHTQVDRRKGELSPYIRRGSRGHAPPLTHRGLQSAVDGALPQPERGAMEAAARSLVAKSGQRLRRLRARPASMRRRPGKQPLVSGRGWTGPLAGWQRSMWSILPLGNTPPAPLLIICEGPRLVSYMLAPSRTRPVGSVCPPKAPPSYYIHTKSAVHWPYFASVPMAN